MVEPAEMNRGLEQVTFVGFDDDGDPVFRCLCDCAMLTDVTVGGMRPGGGVYEFAYTCEGCQSSHWMTIAAQAVPHG